MLILYQRGTMMFSDKMHALGYSKSTIRELFEFGRKRAETIGTDNVFDFSLGNPSVPSPKAVEEAFIKIISEEKPMSVHGYTSAVGDDECRQAIADNLNKRFGTKYSKSNFIITCGAAPALASCFKALSVNENFGSDEDSEFIAIAPYFPEYKVFVENAGARLVVLPADTDDFQINPELLRKAITPATQAVIVNSPNNPSGVVYSSETIKKLSEILNNASGEIGHPIYLISDEPYRELVYRGVTLPFVPDYYKNTIVCYSYSKSLSIPGERIGYILIPDQVTEAESVFYAVSGALRALGHVCAPSLMQRMIAACADVLPDISVYETNSELLYEKMTEIGYHCVKPDGAFYLFFKAPFGISAKEFSELAKEKYNLLVVPGDAFGCPNYLRLSYCIETERIQKAIPLFSQLYSDLKGRMV